jgi:branched-chain amino acid transport system ATP-binding protein
MAQPLLSADKVSLYFDGLRAVHEATLAVAPGRITGLIGPNGAGKTTLFNVMSGILEPTGGSIHFKGERIDNLPPHRIARLGVARTFQDPRIFYEMSVFEHVISGMPLLAENPILALFGGSRTRGEWRSARERAMGLLDGFGLAPRAGDKAQDLSFGEQRFLSIARALASDPTLVLLDEPSVGLDAQALRRLTGLLRRAVGEEGRTILLIEHNMPLMFEVADHIALMFEGSVVATGAPGEMRAHPRMIEAYLGTRYAARNR